MKEAEAKRQHKLTQAMRNRLEAVAAKAGKSPMDARLAMARIFSAIEYSKKMQNRGPRSRQFAEDLQNWRNGAPKFAPDFAAATVRMARLKMGIGVRKHTEENAIKEAAGTTFVSLSIVERRAAEMLMGTKRATRTISDPATRIARAARAEWGNGVEYPRPVKPRLSLEDVIRIAIPIIEEMSAQPVRGGSPKSDYSIEMEPAELGALVALARMHKEGAHRGNM
jgi:hypothetical protein